MEDRAAELASLMSAAAHAHGGGDLGAARELYERVLRSVPQHFEALHLLGIATCQAGDVQGGIRLVQSALSIQPDSPEAHFNLGNALRVAGRHADAIVSFERAAALRPQYLEAHFNCGAALAQGGAPEAALARFEAVLALAPDHFGACAAAGDACAALGHHEAACVNYERALAQRADDADVNYNLGNSLAALARYQEALRRFDRALLLRPAYFAAWCNRGVCLAALGRFEEALSSYARALGLRADDAGIISNQANALLALGRRPEAIQSYERSLDLDAGHVATQVNYAHALRDMGQEARALEMYGRALAREPDSAHALSGRAVALTRLARYEEALEDFERLLQIRPGFRDAAGGRLLASLACCRWDDCSAQVAELEAAITAGVAAAQPLAAIAASDSPQVQHRAARLCCAAEPPAPPPQWRGQRYRHERLRIAYLSADFRDHTVAYKIVALLERHDRRRFEVYGVPLAAADSSAIGRRMRDSCDSLIDVTGASDLEAAQRLRELEIDVAVDLMGATIGHRRRIFAHRPAPVQVSYFGYPGTSGAPYMDYILADRHVAPHSHQECYSECIVHLPDSYFATDGARTTAARTATRADAGLPHSGMVFGALGNSYKITPCVFDVWMRLLHATPGSVLWLSDNGATATRNLRREAQARGVSAQRLVFAPWAATVDEHLTRYLLADLFLDTLPYNAHSTAADALYMGLPVLTCMGRGFASRVGASLLAAIGLAELITSSLADYEATAMRLAGAPRELSELRARLARNRSMTPLFDTDGLRGYIEDAYIAMSRRARAGLSPEPFDVPARVS